MAMYVGFHLFLEADFLFLDTWKSGVWKSEVAITRTYFFKCISRLTVNNLLNKYINMKGEVKLHLCDITVNLYFKIY